MGIAEFTPEELEARGRHSGKAPPLSMAEGMGVAREVALRHGLTVKDMLSKRRGSWLYAARLVLYLELRTLGWSYPMIGELAQRDHTTILAAVVKNKKRTP